MHRFSGASLRRLVAALGLLPLAWPEELNPPPEGWLTEFVARRS